jgi:hypothetical protein
MPGAPDVTPASRRSPMRFRTSVPLNGVRHIARSQARRVEQIINPRLGNVSHRWIANRVNSWIAILPKVTISINTNAGVSTYFRLAIASRSIREFTKDSYWKIAFGRVLRVAMDSN